MRARAAEASRGHNLTLVATDVCIRPDAPLAGLLARASMGDGGTRKINDADKHRRSLTEASAWTRRSR